MTEETSNKSGELDLSSSEGAKPEMTVTRTRKVPLAVMPVTPFGKYNLIGKLGHGGMAEVFLAYVAGPAGFRKLVVIKRLHHQLEEEPGFLDMFLDEARLAARLNHPNIVQCFEVGDVDGSHFIAMEYLEGQGLDRIRRHCVREGIQIPERLVARMLIDALDGLHYAHELKDFDGSPLKIVHRDVSPQNVFVTYDGVVKLLDFGIAKATTHVVETRTGVVKGKFAYMAPEQARGGEIDHRADLWSMGVVLWETLANRRLFKGPNDLATLNQALMGDIPDLRETAPNTSEALLECTSKALSRDADDRYQSALEMKTALEKAFAAEKDGLATRAEVAEFVKGLFEDVIEQHRKVMQICLSDSTAASITSSGMRVAEHTPPDLRMTPSGGYDSSGSGSHSGVLSTPSGQIVSGISGGEPISSHSAMLPLAAPQQQSGGWAGRVGILIGAVVVAVLSTLMVLWCYGPPGDNGREGDRLASTDPGASHAVGEAPARGEPLAPSGSEEPANPTANEAPSNQPAGDETGDGENVAPDNGAEPGHDSEDSTPAAAPGTNDSAEPSGPAKTTRGVRIARPSPRPGAGRPGRNNRPRKQGGSSPRPAQPDPGSAASTPEEPTPAEPEGPTKRRVAEPEEFGFLTIDTMPWAQVSVGGRSLGNTPVIRARLPVGRHTLRLRNPELGITTTYSVEIRAGETTTRRLGLQ